jgi:hypothetical protein
VKRRSRLLLLYVLAACSTPAPYLSHVGILKPGATLTVQVDSATVNAYQPAMGQPRDLYTISPAALPKATPPPAPRFRTGPFGLEVRAPGNLYSLLVRVPDRVDLAVVSRQGNVNVTDITGNARIVAHAGNVNVELPGYAQAAVDNGNLSVTMGATQWPGTLHFSTRTGDIELHVNPKASFGVHLHTDDGMLFTDFGLRGTSTGNAETIDASVNGGSTQRIDVETTAGAIRLLQLHPQP